MILLFYLDTRSDPAGEEAYETALKTLPEGMQQELQRLRSWDARKARIAGRLLLKKAIEHLACLPTLIDRLEKTPDGKPFIPGFADFSISHSNGLVACALNTDGKIGFDVEGLRSVQFKNFGKFFSEKELASMEPDKYEAFFKAWTAREALVKAHGGGMKVWNKITMNPDQTATLDGHTWHLIYPFVNEKYVCCCCSETAREPAKTQAFGSIRELL